MAIADLLTELQANKNNLANNLKTKGVEADTSEGFNTLVPKVLDIVGGDSDLSVPTQTCIGELLTHVLSGNYKSQIITMPSSLPTTEWTVLDADRPIKGFAYYDINGDMTQSNSGNEGAQAIFGCAIYDEEYTCIDACKRTYMDYNSTAPTLDAWQNGSLRYASINTSELANKSFKITCTYGGTNVYSPFKQGHDYLFIVW